MRHTLASCMYCFIIKCVLSFTVTLTPEPRLRLKKVLLFPYEGKYFLSACHIILVAAESGDSGGDSAGLFHATHLHTHMLGLHDDDDALGIESLHNGIGYLSRQAFLHLQTACIDLHGAGQFGEAGDMRAGEIGDVYLPEERQEVVLTKGIEGDVAHQYEPLAVGGIEYGAAQNVVGILSIACGDFGQCLGHTGGGLHQTFTLGVLSDMTEDGLYVGFNHFLLGG